MSKFFLLLLIIQNSLIAYDEATHQYITNEAYAFLRTFIGCDNQEMLNHLHTNFPAGDGGPW